MKITAAAVLITAVAGCFLFVEIIGSRRADNPGGIVWQTREVIHGRINDSFGTGRVWIWRRGMRVILDRPVLGSGPDTFYYALSDFQDEAIELFGVRFDKAHNTFLQIAVCMGMPALLAYLVFLAGLLAPALKAASNRPLLAAFCAAVLSYLIQSFFQIDTPIDKPILWAALGVVAGEIRRDTKSTTNA